MADEALAAAIPKPSDISKANIDRLGDQKDDLIQQICVREIGRSEIEMEPWKERIVKWTELYKMYQQKKHYDGLAQIFVPEILRAVETVVGNLYKAITQEDPFFEYVGRTDADDASALAQTQLTMYQMDENGFRHRLMDSLRQCALSGLTVRKVLWDFNQVARTRKNYAEESEGAGNGQKPTSFKKWKKEVFVDTVKDHWTFEPVDLLALHLPDVRIPYNDIQKSEWIAEQYIVNKEYVKQRIKKGWFIDVDFKAEGLSDQAPQTSRTTMLMENRIRTSGFTIKAKQGRSGIELIERWGLLRADLVYDGKGLDANDLDGDEMVEAVCVIANRKTILKLEPNPFWHNQKPYLFCPYVPQEFEFDGIGVGQIGEKLQEELNDTRNQVMDNKTLILMTMWLKSRSSGIKNQDLRVRPLGVIATNDMNGLMPLRPPVVTGIGVNIEATVKNDLREATGAASNLQGIAQAGVGSATESQEVTQASMGRLAMTAELYGELILKPLLIMVEYMNYQFYDHTKTIRIFGPLGIKFKKIAPEDLIGYKDIRLKVSTELGHDPATEKQQAMQFLTIIQQMQPPQIQFFWKLLDKIYRLQFGGRSLSEVFPAPVDPSELLSLDEEVDIILSGYPLTPQQRPDARVRSLQLEQEFHKYKFVLSPQVFEIFKNAILGYEQMAMAQMQAQKAQFQAQMMMQQQKGGGQQGPPQGMIPGQMNGMTAFTQPQGAPAVNGAQTVGA